MMKTSFVAVAAGLLLSTSGIAPLYAQMEGPASTQVLVGVESKSNELPSLANVTISVNGKKEQPTSWTPVAPNGTQIALLIDNGLRESIGTQLSTLEAFIAGLPSGTEIYVGYMQNGTVFPGQSFTTDHGAAAHALHLPLGAPGISASPYFCLSDFVKHWPSTRPAARFVMMITNGVDPYNGSTSIMNQDSPYVDAAQEDAQRAGVAVSSIYFSDAGFRGNRGSFSGQSYLTQVGEATGGVAYYLGTGNPPTIQPFLENFQKQISETFIATFPAEAKGKDLARIKVAINLHTVKVHAPEEIRPGNMEAAQ